MPMMLNLELADKQAPDIVARLQQIVALCEWFVGEAITAPDDLNVHSVLILGRMAKLDGPMKAGELRTKGFYTGSNVSYNLKLLVDKGYVTHEKSNLDRRAVVLTLTKKGLKIGEPAARVIRYLDEHVGSVFSLEDFSKAKGFLGESLHTGLELNVTAKARAKELA